MTNDYKDLLLEYLTGNLTNDYDVSNMTPYYEDVEYRNDSARPLIGMSSIECLDGTGKPNGKSIFYKPNGVKALYLVDNEMNILNVYTMWNTGTDFQRFLKLGVDEEGQLYGIDYDELNDKYRFILMNNISEPTKMPDGSLEYRAVLRNSYFIQGYTSEDDVSPNSPVYLGKATGQATYYFAFTDSILEVIMPSTLTINVGAANEWTRLTDVLTSYGAHVLDNIIYFNSEGTPHVSYFIYDSYMYNKIRRIDIIGDGAPSYTDLIDMDFVEQQHQDSQGIDYDLIALSKDNYYFVIREWIYYGNTTKPYQLIYVYKNGYTDYYDFIWEKGKLKDEEGASGRVPKAIYNTTPNGDLSIFYRLIDDTDNTLDKVGFNFIPNAPEYDLPTMFFDKDTTTTIKSSYDWVSLINRTYNLYKFICQTTGTSGTNNTYYTTISLIYNDDNYNTEPFEENGTDNRTLLPNQGILLDTNNKPIYARNLYNHKTYKNKSTSVLNVPNNMLNDISINKNKLISMFNNDIIENTDSIEKNIYEDLYINYFNTITMQNQDYSTYKDNLDGAIRINQSTNKLSDYENAKATKVKITYDDGTYIIGGVNNSINNGVCTYEFYVYVPDLKKIEKVEIMSEDEETIYQTIDYFPESLLATKTYKIQQDVRVE